MEELGLAYQVIPVNTGKGSQFTPGFLAITSNRRVSATIDPSGPVSDMERENMFGQTPFAAR